MPRHSLVPNRLVPESPRCQHSNSTFYALLASVTTKLQAAIHVLESSRCQHSNVAFHIFLASVATELQAAIEMLFNGKFLVILKTDISTPRDWLMPIRYVPESPQYQHSNVTSYILLASVPAELQAAIKIFFTGNFLQILKTDISTPRDSLIPIRYVPESPRCQYSNVTCHILLASVSAELQATIEMIFMGEVLLILKTDISMSGHSFMLFIFVSESR
ncbi:hypothetical protein L873DRAFT_1787478 [Choiromyces venosus 120613-1]|uniref:Uncharacterized protein n=1 Tax=Choiromyces venosus 120613-1 TaxID=1336337 RepID=A0A3N4KA02_9PEZI|nr:hypothetical protein L873DRAFT_1787478 [Choiromyces venosus 120613-1]